MGNGMRALILLGLTACGPTGMEVSGSSQLLNLTPAPPTFVGGFDFELFGQVEGKSCADRKNTESTYWVGVTDLAKVSSDPLTRRAIAAAAFDAISHLDADSLVLTRVVAEGHGPDRVCATVFGRAVRLTKAPIVRAAPVPPPATTP